MKEDGKIKEADVTLPDTNGCDGTGCMAFDLFGVSETINNDKIKQLFSELVIIPYVKSLPKTHNKIEGVTPLLDIEDKDAFVDFFIRNTTYDEEKVVYL